MSQKISEKIVQNLVTARRRTLALFELAEETVLHQSPGFGFRPILWHLAHIGVFEEFWLRQKLSGAEPFNKRYQRIFDPINTPRENSKNLPSKAEMLDYLAKVREDVLKTLENFESNEDDPLFRNGYIFDLVHQHELQHQETLAYLFHLLPPATKTVQSASHKVKPREIKSLSSVLYPSSAVKIGAAADAFVYDNELPAHEVSVPAFRFARFLTTNEQYAEFIAENGYGRSEFWSEEGWQFREKENWQHPVYWQKTDGGWQIRTMFAESAMQETKDHPVYGISFYEAEAYAKFRGKRLPTEFEWERAASSGKETEIEYSSAQPEPTSENCNFDFQFWNTTPVGSFPEESECFDLKGNLWEWTSSAFQPYPGFVPFPYPEYSEEWFDGDHKVLKGGSWATSKPILRTSFRNFFRRHFRIAFAGIRLAEDA